MRSISLYAECRKKSCTFALDLPLWIDRRSMFFMSPSDRRRGKEGGRARLGGDEDSYQPMMLNSKVQTRLAHILMPETAPSLPWSVVGSMASHQHLRAGFRQKRRSF